MPIQRTRNRMKLAAAGAGLAAASLVVSAAGSASAAISTGRVQLCSQGNYASYLTFTGNGIGGVATGHVAAGSCTTFSVPGASSGPTYVQIYGVYNVSQSSFYLGETTSSPQTAGMKIATTGTSTSPSWKFLSNN